MNRQKAALVESSTRFKYPREDKKRHQCFTTWTKTVISLVPRSSSYRGHVSGTGVFEVLNLIIFSVADIYPDCIQEGKSHAPCGLPSVHHLVLGLPPRKVIISWQLNSSLHTLFERLIRLKMHSLNDTPFTFLFAIRISLFSVMFITCTQKLFQCPRIKHLMVTLV